jgi:broad-specificity NMP kinase
MLLSGPRGTGKTTCAAQLKPFLEQKFLSLGEKVTVRVFSTSIPPSSEST